MLHFEEPKGSPDLNEEKHPHHAKENNAGICPYGPYLPPGTSHHGMHMCYETAKFRDGYEHFRKKSIEFAHEIPDNPGFAPLFTTHIFGHPAIAIAGAKEAKLFYDSSLVERSKAYPHYIQKSIIGRDTIMSLDGPEHEARKKVMMESFDNQHLQFYIELYAKICTKYLEKWESEDHIQLKEELILLNTEFAMAWILGIRNPLESEIKVRAKQLVSLFNLLGGTHTIVEIPGSRESKASHARNQLQIWIGKFIKEHRDGERQGNIEWKGSTFESYLEKICGTTDLEGNPFSERVLAAEIVNVFRHTVQTAYLQIFGFLTFAEHEKVLEEMRRDIKIHISNYSVSNKLNYYENIDLLKKIDYLQWYTKELKRYYPIIPLLVAKVKNGFQYKNYYFPKDYFLILGVHAIHRDPRIWSNPDKFDPMRFSKERQEHKNFDKNYTIVQQGGGDVLHSHRCPGEKLASYMVSSLTSRLVHDYDWDVPNQDLSFSLLDIPTLPKSGMFIKNFKSHLPTNNNHNHMDAPH